MMCDGVRCHYVPLPSSLQFLSPHPIYSLWSFDFSRSEDWLLPGPAGGELCSDRWINVWSECPKYVDFLKWIPSLIHSTNPALRLPLCLEITLQESAAACGPMGACAERRLL